MEFKLDKAAIKLFSDANKPILGICGGLQSINVCFDGSLNQKIENHDLRDRLHEVSITKDTFLSTIYKKRGRLGKMYKLYNRNKLVYENIDISKISFCAYLKYW